VLFHDSPPSSLEKGAKYMPHSAFEMISKAYPRRKKFLQRISPSTASRNHTSVFTQKISGSGEQRLTRRLETIKIVSQFPPSIVGEKVFSQQLRQWSALVPNPRMTENGKTSCSD
jgi:hypothetical protein